MLIALMIMAAAATPPPGAEAEALGVRLAATGAFQIMLPMIAGRETEELIAAHPELSSAERDRLRDTAHEMQAKAGAKIAAAMGHEYAAALSLGDLRALVAFNESPVAGRYRAAVPGVTMKGLTAIGKFDFKGDVAKAFCAQAGKLCTK